MKHGARRQRRLFSYSLMVALAFWGALVLFGATMWMPWGEQEYKPEAVEAVGERGQSRTVLLLVHDAENQLTGAVSVKGDTRTLTMCACAYPVETEVMCGTQVWTLAQCYTAGGKAAAASLETATQEQYDAIVLLSAEAVSHMVAYWGNGVMYVLPESVGALPAGEQVLTSVQMADLLRYTGWSDKGIGQATVHAGLTAAVLNRYLTAACDLQQAFSRLTSLCEEHLTVAQFTAVRGELEQLAAANHGAICTASVAQGRWVESETASRYLLTE